MSVKLPRTKENYPNHRRIITGKIEPEAMDFIQDFHWEIHETISTIVYYAFNYVLKNKDDFIKFCKESKDKEI